MELATFRLEGGPLDGSEHQTATDRNTITIPVIVRDRRADEVVAIRGGDLKPPFGGHPPVYIGDHVYRRAPERPGVMVYAGESVRLEGGLADGQTIVVAPGVARVEVPVPRDMWSTFIASYRRDPYRRGTMVCEDR